MIGSSPAMQKIRQFILQVAASDSTILISGETGTGKELVAKAIHENSTRRHKSMVKVNCAALPPGLIESELFGHEKGSFTDAIDRKIGKFELADNSTLFLDEIGELPPELQVKLLRALQEKEIERIGGTQIIRTDVRIIAATNRCLRKEMQAGRFRSDLFYRLNVLPIVLPPLRERREDIPALAAGFIYKYARKSGTKITGLSANALQELMAYHWPGNIRELEHLIERSMLLNQSPQIMKIDIPSPDTSQMAPNFEKSPDGSFRIRSLEEVERDHILAILKKCNGKVAGEGGAARLLNIPSTTLNGKIRRLGIKKNFIAGLTKAILFFLLTTPILHAAAQQSTEQVFQNTALLHGDSIVFPLTMVNAYPFVSVEVNGIQGKFMFDTGLNGDIEINDNAVYLPGKKPVKKGQVGSGQSFIRNINDTIAEVKFKNGLTYRSLLKITSANFDFLQKNITPDCIGYIGHDFFNGYLFKLDYLRRKLTFYKNTEQRKLSKDFLKGENVLATLDFETRRLPNHPMVHVKIGNVDLLGSFDTGQYGLLQLDDQAAKALKNASLVIPAGNDAYNDTLINVNNIVINGEFTLSVKGIYPLTLEQTAPFRKGMQVTETSYICFGYRFLDQYKTVWDYADKKIYILEK
ncbi:MAG: sigma-54-dependent Fis family transcriptional regulator [Bacteroidetes bacterium]|nr:sigma-54-dependent Fis family transcriptional regulator [Bacteroidota bacterium]